MYVNQIMTITTLIIVINIINSYPHQFIDFWMLFCLTIPVLEIVLHTVEDHFIRK